MPSFRLLVQVTSKCTLVPFFWYRGTSECTFVPVSGTGQHSPKPPFWKPPFCEPRLSCGASKRVLPRGDFVTMKRWRDEVKVIKPMSFFLMSNASLHRLAFLSSFSLTEPRSTLPDTDRVSFTPIQRTLPWNHCNEAPLLQNDPFRGCWLEERISCDQCLLKELRIFAGTWDQRKYCPTVAFSNLRFWQTSVGIVLIERASKNGKSTLQREFSARFVSQSFGECGQRQTHGYSKDIVPENATRKGGWRSLLSGSIFTHLFVDSTGLQLPQRCSLWKRTCKREVLGVFLLVPLKLSVSVTWVDPALRIVISAP